MIETNINQNNQQQNNKKIKESVDPEPQVRQDADQVQMWGPDSKAYYKETWSSYNATPSSLQAEEQQKASENPSGLKEFAQKVLKALKFKKKGNFEEPKSVKKTNRSNVSQTDNLGKSISSKLGVIKQEAEKEYEQTKDSLTKTVIDITEGLQNELQKEPVEWKKVDNIIKKLVILLVQKMANNDGVNVLEEIKMMKEDVDNIYGTFNTNWELMLGISAGCISTVAGTVGAMKGTKNGLFYLSKSLSEFITDEGKLVSSISENKRKLYELERERDSINKQTSESSLQGNKSIKGSQMSQRDRAIEAGYRAFLQILQ
jgi:hypothetical protein